MKFLHLSDIHFLREYPKAEKDVKRLEGGGLGSAVAASAALGGAALLWKILRG